MLYKKKDFEHYQLSYLRPKEPEQLGEYSDQAMGWAIPDSIPVRAVKSAALHSGP